MSNATFITEFVLLGFSELYEVDLGFYTLLLLMYLLSLVGHSLIIIVVSMESKLHTPMYFFLLNFSMAEISSTTSEMPKMLIPSATGRSKAFFICDSHLTVITIFYTVLMIMYLRPSTHGDSQLNKILSLFHTCFIPMLNPFIYTIRNSDFKTALWKAITKMKRRS
ncbi:hypothetical protein E2320_003522 [Naja naja]|nr:hypothetical protein E2320_003522 [Naja naja]